MTDQNPRDLFDRATNGLTSDVDRLVSGGIARGRRAQRRRRAGSMLAAVAVFGVVGAAASFIPHATGRDGTPVASDPTVSPSASPTAPSPTTSPTASPTGTASSSPADPTVSDPPPFVADHVTVTPEQVPVLVEEQLGRQGAGPIRTGPSYGSAGSADRLIAHFSWQGTLASVVIERFPGDGQAACQQSVGPTGGTCSTDEAGHPMLLWGPTLGDGVEAQGATVWRDGFEVAALSYNAADGKNSPPLFTHPPLTMDELTLLATADAWFS
ncbi:hypothetical protein FB382_004244 [Nocardioides ginsengisegetis]|uniref:Uncharacterized protein n=1 Tax=Nocardioides ginsengisegetis TaxID=661491 RepID=A0A7W3J4B1_9ACTN|nr:hypothetical protein [Nocardioides ginsengisegetis]MBA8805899.1 hypothetical protein [Nocardioides ginsengisegetis]